MLPGFLVISLDMSISAVWKLTCLQVSRFQAMLWAGQGLVGVAEGRVFHLPRPVDPPSARLLSSQADTHITHGLTQGIYRGEQ